MCLGKNPARPKTRINVTGADTRHLLEHLNRHHPDLLDGPQVQALPQVLVKNYHCDPAGRLRWRDDDESRSLPPSANRIISPYDLTARYARRGQVTRWQGFLAHVTETCSGDSPNVITDVATSPPPVRTPKSCPASTPDCTTGAVDQTSTWSTAATHP